MKNLKQRLYHILEAGRTYDRPSVIFDWSICILIILNVIAATLETVEPIGQNYKQLFWTLEVFSVAVFTAEYICRLWVCNIHVPLQKLHPAKARLKFASTPFLIIDLIAILPFYLSFLIPADLRILRIFRLLRIMKLGRYSPALVTIARVLYTERRALLGTLIIMLGLLLLASTLAFYAEREAQPDKFANIPQAMWWAVATLTTVGYGDVAPITLYGKLVGAVFMVFGLGMFALPIGIIATGYSQEIHRRDFVVSWGLVAKVNLFSGLKPEELVEIAKLLLSRTVPSGQNIARYGDAAESMYFIVDGEVELDFMNHNDNLIVSSGEYFGEMALLHDTKRKANINARTDCQLLMLEASDFHRLMVINPEINKRVIATAQSRGYARQPKTAAEAAAQELSQA